MALALTGLCLGPVQADQADVSSVSMTAGPRPTAGQHPTAMPSLGVKAPQNAAVASQVLTLVNQARSREGLAPLKLHGTLTRIAVEHSLEMESSGDVQATPALWIQNSGLKAGLAGGNIFTAQALDGEELAQAVLETWLTSEPDRSNLFDPRATHLGVAVLQFSERSIVTGLLVGQLRP